MIGNLMQKGALRLPAIRPVSQPFANTLKVIRSRPQSVLLASVAGVAVIAVAFTAFNYVRHSRSVAEAQAAASRVETANIDLQDELARLRDQVAASGRDLAAAQSRVASLNEEVHARSQPQPVPAEPAPSAAKGDKSVQLSQQLHVAEAQRATLAARLSKAEAELNEQQSKQNELLGQIEQWQKKLEQTSTDRDRLKARVGELEKQSALKRAQAVAAAAARPAPAAAPAAAAVATTAMAAPQPQAAPRPQAEPQGQQRVAGVLNGPQAAVAQPAPAPVAPANPAPAAAPAAAASAPVVVAHGAVDQFARVLASAGVDVRHLFSQYGVNRGEGGPVVPLARGQVVPDTMTPEKLAALRAMVKVLPVHAPLDGYEISSPFGPRGDPEDGRGEFHTGVDLRAPYDSPVYATAPGVVTYAGYRDDYGKIVEIDHGNGIATRYAHLHAFTVSVGQRVALHQQIGYLGSTGRATGPHTHYEVVVNGEPQDPQKFMNLGRYVPSMTVPVAARN
jgi:murein DD-endopeptidase MepM/ murein hydrolase activator NlpD